MPIIFRFGLTTGTSPELNFETASNDIFREIPAAESADKYLRILPLKTKPSHLLQISFDVELPADSPTIRRALPVSAGGNLGKMDRSVRSGRLQT